MRYNVNHCRKTYQQPNTFLIARWCENIYV